MEAYKQQFIEFMVRAEVLTFGDFITKSGRNTPYFMNAGRYDSGARLARVGEFYAEAFVQRLGLDACDLLFGPAYKGIPLVTATATALALHHQRDFPIAFNRKEAKDHGEGGTIIGRAPRDGDRVVIIEDVTTAGTSIRETVELFSRIAQVRLAGLIVSVDRQERGTGDKSALAEIRETHGMPAFAIVTLDEIVDYLHNREIDGHVVLDDPILHRIQAYREQYGAR